MGNLLLSRITKDYLNYDPALLPERERYRMGWSGSLLATHPKSEKKKRGAQLSELRERFASLFEPRKPLPLTTSPKLAKPLDPPLGTVKPAWYFSRGAVEVDRKKNPEPILYLLTETNETAKARPVPGNSYLFRSLCKGKGVLKQNGQGMIYLDVDNRFISMMMPYLKAHKLVKPPYSALFGTPEGAHVPVISAREAAFQYLSGVEEVGNEFSFEIEGLYSMEPASWPEVEQVWFFKICSPELESLRQRHFLPALPGGHAFHIVVAIQPRPTSNNAGPLPLARINPSFSEA